LTAIICRLSAVSRDDQRNNRWIGHLDGQIEYTFAMD
jgi:hypothetical protein